MAVAALATLAGTLGEVMFGDSILWFLVIFFGVLLLMLNAAIIYNNPRAVYRKHPFLRQRYEIEFSEVGIEFRTTDTQSKYKWNFYKQIIETDENYFLLYEGNWFSLIPKRAFNSALDEQTFRSLLKRHVD